MESVERNTPNYLMVERGLLGLTRLIGVATWGITFLAYFLTDINSWQIYSWLFGGFFTWLAAGQLKSAWIANTIQFLTLTLILGTPVIFDVANQDSWIPITVIGLNLVAILSFQIKNWLAWPVMLALILIIKILIDLDLYSYLYGGAKFESGLVSLSYLAVVGVVAWHLKNITLNQAKSFDDAISIRNFELEKLKIVQIERETNQAIARRLHESVLNTLNAITRMHSVSLLKEARLIAGRDIAALEEVTKQIKPMPLEELIAEALDLAGLEGYKITIDPGCDVEVSIKTFTPLLESILEVLRNIERHSQAKSVSIHWICNPKHIELIIKDDGCGFDLSAEKKSRFGQKVIFHSELKKLGHAIQVNSEIGKGTEVVWQLTEYIPSASALEVNQEWPGLTQENFAFRLLFLAIPLFIAALLPLLTAGFSNQFLTVLNFIGCVVLLTLCATVDSQKYRMILLPLTVVSIFWGQLSLIDQTSNCVAALPIQWIMNGYTVGILLVMILNFRSVLKVAIIVVNFLLLILVASSLGSCQEIVLLPGLTGVVLSAGIIFGLKRLNEKNIAAMIEHGRALAKFFEYQLRQNSHDRAYLRLQTLTKDAQTLLGVLLDADENLDLAELKEQSKIQESFLRSALIIIEFMSLDTQQGMLEMLSRLARNKVVVAVESLTVNLENLVWPPSLVEFGNEFSNEFSNGTCKLFFYEENSELILVIEADGEMKESFSRFDFVEDFTNTHIRCSINLGPVKHSLEQIEQ